MRWTRAAFARGLCSQGEAFGSRERFNRATTTAQLADGKAEWSWHPLLMLSPAEASIGPTGRAVPSIRGMTVAKRNSSPGRAGNKLLKPLRREGRLIRHTCGDYRVLPTTARGPRVHWAPGLPCALVVSEGQRSYILRALPAPRRYGRLLPRLKIEYGRRCQRESDPCFGRVHRASSLDAVPPPWCLPRS
jgi:hypothetical protein